MGGLRTIQSDLDDAGMDAESQQLFGTLCWDLFGPSRGLYDCDAYFERQLTEYVLAEQTLRWIDAIADRDPEIGAGSDRVDIEEHVAVTELVREDVA